MEGRAEAETVPGRLFIIVIRSLPVSTNSGSSRQNRPWEGIHLGAEGQNYLDKKFCMLTAS